MCQTHNKKSMDKEYSVLCTLFLMLEFPLNVIVW